MERISRIDIDDPIDQSDRAIEVTVTLDGGERRWCYFMTPEIARNCGDYIAGTTVRVHRGAAHLFIVSEVDEAIITRVLESVAAEGGIVECTLPL